MSYDLEVENVSKRFGSLVAVDNVSFNIPSGSFFSILGPSGCGKTTLMRMIAGFESPNSGDIRIKGKSVIGSPPNKRNVKMVFQHLALFPMMNVAENIAYGLRCQGMGKAEISDRIKNVLDRVSLPDVAEKEINQLSGGQKQRIAIARCMVLDPDVLLLDEPLGALDLKLRESMKIELKQLQHQFGTTFIYITHDQSEALVMSDHIAAMKDGRFEQIGTPQELYHSPRTPFVAGFVGDSNRWTGTVISAEGEKLKVSTDDGLTLVGVAANQVSFSAGDKVQVFVRPEFISVTQGSTTGAAEGRNSITGRVDSLLFNGANSRVLIRTDHGETIEADFPMAGHGDGPKAGDTVSLSWSEDRSACFPSNNGVR